METMHNELKKLERENNLMEEKLKHAKSELDISHQKTNKYKRIAKTFKINIDSIEQTLVNLKKMSAEEVKTLQ